MTTALKSIVSKQKKRFQDDKYDLDLSCKLSVINTFIFYVFIAKCNFDFISLSHFVDILPNLIAMGYPADKVQRLYRNSIDEVKNFFEERHKGHYKIYNLCSERHYDPTKFHNRVASFPIDDHNPPKFELIKMFCEDVKKWLGENSNNVAAIHCKAGKGRTGVMVCSYIIHAALCDNAIAALNLYAERRTKDNKGVTIPSQRRYVHYYEKLIKSNIEYHATAIFIESIITKPMPIRRKVDYVFVVRQGKRTLFQETISEKTHKSSKEEHIYLPINNSLRLEGDVKVDVYKNVTKRSARLFSIWFNTFFVDLEYKSLQKSISNGGPSSTKKNVIPVYVSSSPTLPLNDHRNPLCTSNSQNHPHSHQKR